MLLNFFLFLGKKFGVRYCSQSILPAILKVGYLTWFSHNFSGSYFYPHSVKWKLHLSLSKQSIIKQCWLTKCEMSDQNQNFSLQNPFFQKSHCHLKLMTSRCDLTVNIKVTTTLKAEVVTQVYIMWMSKSYFLFSSVHLKSISKSKYNCVQ